MFKKILPILSFIMMSSNAQELDLKYENVIEDNLLMGRIDKISVTNLTRKIMEENDPREIKSIDLKDNDIASTGAMNFLKFIYDNRNDLVKLSKIDLSHNLIRIYKEDNDFSNFVSILKNVLEIPQIEEINMSINPITKGETIGNIRCIIGFNLMTKVVCK